MNISTAESTSSDKTSYNKRDLPKKGFHEIAKIKMIEKIDPDQSLPSFYSLVTDELDKESLNNSEKENTLAPAQTCCSSVQKRPKKNLIEEINIQPISPQHIQTAIRTNSINYSSEIKIPLNIDILTLIDTIGAEMILMNVDGTQETTLKLGNKYPIGSILNGLEITISEFNIAPKIFNIKLISSYQSIEKIIPHIPQLMQVFRERKFDFSINRIDTEISSDKPLFCRKIESENDSHSDQQGSTNQ